MEQIIVLQYWFRYYQLGKHRFCSQKLGLCALQVRETTVCRKYGRKFRLNDILQVIIGGEHYVGWQVYFECFLGMFAKLWRVTIRLDMSVCPSSHMEQLGSYWIDFREIWCLSIFKKFVKEIEVLLISYKNNGCFTWRPVCIFDHISLISS